MNVQATLRIASHHVTWFLGTRFPKSIPLVFVLGYPKSGTTWACQLAADYLQLPFPRYSLLPVGFPAVVHGHERVSKKYPKGIYVVRDGRDALVSHYFSLASRIPDGDHPRLTASQRRLFPGLVNKTRVRDNIAAFIQRQMTKPHSSRVNWAGHVRSFYEVNHPRMTLLRYEDLVDNGEAHLAEAVSKLTGKEADPERVRDTVKKFSFQRQSRRPSGQASPSFLRKGQAGDWVNHFTREAAEIFDHYCGEVLITAGYERDHSWVHSVEPAPVVESLGIAERTA